MKKTISSTAFLLLVLVFTLTMQVKAASTDSFYLYDNVELNTLQSLHKFDALHENAGTVIRTADKLLTKEPPSVTAKTVLPPSADPHDYISIAIYYWPDSSKPDGLPYINHDGRVNPEKNDLNRYDGSRIENLVSSVDKLSLAYYLTGKEEYAAKAVEFLKVWFINPNTKMNPNLNYGQIVPGKGGGRPSGIIETTILIRVIDAAHMLEKSPSFSQAEQQALKNWFSEYLTWLLTNKIGISESKTTNNHGVWYDAQVAAFAHFAGRDDIALRVLNEAPQKRMQIQIEPDGSMPRELARTKSMSYTAFNLQAFITLARVGDTLGVNLWDYESQDGRGIRKAIDYWIPYVLKQKQWEHEQIEDYHGSGFARYLYFAKLHYNTDQYDEAIAELVKK